MLIALPSISSLLLDTFHLFLYLNNGKFLTLLTVASVVVVHLTFLAIYRLYFHPLSKFPGPKLAAVSDYWELYQDFLRKESGYLFIELDNLHEKYGMLFEDIEVYFVRYDLRSAGPIVRIRPNEVHIRDSKWMDVLYTGPSDVCAKLLYKTELL